MNLTTSAPSANCSTLLVLDSKNFFDQDKCFLKDVLVSEQISYWLEFDKIAYILSSKYRGQVSFKNLKALEKSY